jgi:pimeloyl-ACP methyl ester carboxylesterase
VIVATGQPPIVFLNAFPVSRAQWEPLLASLGSNLDRDVITFDMPGIGDMPPSDEEPSLTLIADAAVAAMREATGWTSALWLGCSMGGYVAMAVAERSPQAVAGLALMGTKSTADSVAAREARLSLAERLDGLTSHPDPAGAAEGLVGTVGPGRSALVAAVTADIASHAAAGIAWGQRAMAARPDRTEVLRNVDAPTVVMRGEHDGIVSAADADHLADALGLAAITIAGAGHLVAFEAPALVAEALSALEL